MKKAALTAGVALGLVFTGTSAIAQSLGNGARVPVNAQGLFGVLSTGGATVPLLGTNLPLASTSALQPVIEPVLGTSQVPNTLAEPAFAAASPLALGTAVPALKGLSETARGPAGQLADPVVKQALDTVLPPVRAVSN